MASLLVEGCGCKGDCGKNCGSKCSPNTCPCAKAKVRAAAWRFAACPRDRHWFRVRVRVLGLGF